MERFERVLEGVLLIVAVIDKVLMLILKLLLLSPVLIPGYLVYAIVTSF